MSTLTRENLVEHIQRLTTSGGANNRLVVTAGDHYAIFHGRRGAAELVVEAVTNFYLQGPAQLTPARVRVLGERGFAERPGKNNVFRDVRPADPAELAHLADDTLALFATVYGVPLGEPASFELQLGDPDPTRNPELARAMRALALRRDMDSRHRVYVAVMNGTFLVPTDPDAPRSDEPKTVDHLGGLPVFAAFTDLDSLHLWQPRGCPFVQLSGAKLVPLAVARKVGSLLLNPRGNVGGELYLNELRSIAEALQRRAN